MDEGFFKFGKATFGTQKCDGDLLTADVEEDVYDALNNETFGDAVFDSEDWEENHEKLAELINPIKVCPTLHYAILDNDDIDDHIGNGSKEIIEQSLSQLGLEDDLDLENLAITSYETGCQTRDFRPTFGSSPPPPAIIDSEECGSPKTRSIWSTDRILQSSTPSQTTNLGSLLKSLQSSNITPTYQPSPQPNILPLFGSSSSSCEVSSSSTGIPITARRLEDVERDLLDCNNVSMTQQGWPISSMAVHAANLEQELLGQFQLPTTSSSSSMGNNWGTSNHQDLENAWNRPVTPPMPITGRVRTLDEVEKDILEQNSPMANQLERFLQNNVSPQQFNNNSNGKNISAHQRSPPGFSGPPIVSTGNSLNRNPQPPIGTPPQCTSVFSHLTGSPICTSPVPICRMSPMVSSPLRSQMSPPVLQQHPLLNPQRIGPALVHSSGIIRHQHQVLPARDHPLLAQADLRRILYQRQIHHPFLNTQFIPPMPNLNQPPPNWPPHQVPNRPQTDRRSSFSSNIDEYAGLMTQREKEWLVRIQMLQLHTDNPYVDDYYHTTYIMRKMIREKRKADGKGNDVKLVLPEMGRHESKTYVPMQFENSLGKLQAISVNFPRRVLEMDVQLAGAEEDNRLPANKELHRQRRLLLDIEKLYSILLEIDDEEKRMFALPEQAHPPHREKRENLIDTLFESLGCSNPRITDEKLAHMACIRKGRHLLFRSMILVSQERQVSLLASLLRSIGSIVRRDVNDRVLIHYLQEVTEVIETCNFDQLLIIGHGLRNGAPLEQYNGGIVSPSRERGNYIAGLHNQFGVTLICTLFRRAEELYLELSDLKNDLKNEWKQIVHHVIDSICSVPVFNFHNSVTDDLLTHLQRFSIDDEKTEILKNKCNINH